MSTFHFHQIDSAVLDRKRKIRVWIPDGYEDGTTYPLLLQADGQMAFTERDPELPYGSWGIDEVITRLAREGNFRPPVVVAVDNSPQRLREYYPVTEEFGRYEQFITEELLPWIRSNYRVADDPREVAAMGSSMGGMVSCALALHNPHLFGAAACLSPWFEHENNRYVHDELRHMHSKVAVRLYMDSGIFDWRGLDDGHRGMLLARLEFLRLGWQEGKDLVWEVDTYFPQDADYAGSAVKEDKRAHSKVNQHTEFHWRRRVHKPLRFLFGK